jgi:hypothetical protein
MNHNVTYMLIDDVRQENVTRAVQQAQAKALQALQNKKYNTELQNYHGNNNSETKSYVFNIIPCTCINAYYTSLKEQVNALRKEFDEPQLSNDKLKDIDGKLKSIYALLKCNEFSLNMKEYDVSSYITESQSLLDKIFIKLRKTTQPSVIDCNDYNSNEVKTECNCTFNYYISLYKQLEYYFTELQNDKNTFTLNQLQEIYNSSVKIQAVLNCNGEEFKETVKTTLKIINEMSTLFVNKFRYSYIGGIIFDQNKLATLCKKFNNEK